MKERVAVTLLALAFSAGAQAQVFKCVDAAGAVTFSDTPCGGAQQVERVEIKGQGQPLTENQLKLRELELEQSRLERELRQSKRQQQETSRRYDRAINKLNQVCRDFDPTRLRTMIVRRQVVPGMKVSDAQRAWGSPTRVNGNQYVYHWPEASSYFYVTDGCVRSVDGTFRGK